MSEPITNEMEAMLLFRKHKQAPFKNGDWTVGGRLIAPKLLQAMVDKGLIGWLSPNQDGDNTLRLAPRFDIGN